MPLGLLIEMKTKQVSIFNEDYRSITEEQDESKLTTNLSKKK